MIVQNRTHYNNRGDLQNIASSAAILKGCVINSCKFPRSIKTLLKIDSYIGNLYDQVSSLCLILLMYKHLVGRIKEIEKFDCKDFQFMNSGLGSVT